MAAVNQRCQSICDLWDKLGTLTQKRREALEVGATFKAVHKDKNKKAYVNLRLNVGETYSYPFDKFFILALSDISLLLVSS